MKNPHPFLLPEREGKASVISVSSVAFLTIRPIAEDGGEAGTGTIPTCQWEQQS